MTPRKHLFLVLFAAALCLNAGSQTPINTFTTVSNLTLSGGTSTQAVVSHVRSYNNVNPTTGYTVKYNNTGNVNLVDFTMSGKTYVRYKNFDTVILRRVANAWETTNGNKQLVFCQGPNSIDNGTYQIPMPVGFPTTGNSNYMEKVMKDSYLNRGVPNLFLNDSTADKVYSNVERADFVIYSGVSTNDTMFAGFVVAERGGNNAFKMAAITAIDASGNPTAFGKVITVNSTSFGSTLFSMSTVIMRKDVADNTLRPYTHSNSQSVKSVFVRFADLGIKRQQKIYGYALMGTDVTATTSAQLLNVNSSTYFPRTTQADKGGFDLAGTPGVFHTNQVLAGHYLTLNVDVNNCTPVLGWTDPEASQVKEYRIEKSEDQQRFTEINVVRAGSALNFTDKKFNATSFYRVKAVMQDGETYYSTTVMATNRCSMVQISAYPNPARESITVSLGSGSRPSQVSVLSLQGQLVNRVTVSESTEKMQLDISKLNAGRYMISVSYKDQAPVTTAFIKM